MDDLVAFYERQSRTGQEEHQIQERQRCQEAQLQQILREFFTTLNGINNGSRVSGDSVERTIPEFKGTEDISAVKWFTHFEETSAAYEFSEIQMLVHAKNKMSGDAKLFLQSQNVLTYAGFKQAIIEEFPCNFSSKDIHTRMAQRKKTTTLRNMRRKAKYFLTNEEAIPSYDMKLVLGDFNSKVAMTREQYTQRRTYAYETYKEAIHI
uniref:Retrotransposon gag domain-containing protein n=1 Tax=Megaselia scalaris TaxID=36166 RepID=T1H1D6_MEGSC